MTTSTKIDAMKIDATKIDTTKIDVTDIQGFVLKGYNFPLARYLLLELGHPEAAQKFIAQTVQYLTTGERWSAKPATTVNIAFTFNGLAKLELPAPTLDSFPVEFQQGMRARGEILYDTGKNAPEHWDPVWREDRVHVWLAVNAQNQAALDQRCDLLLQIATQTGGAKLLQAQDACATYVDGHPKEHFGYSDGFGNPDFKGADRKCTPGQGKLTENGTWEALATGEFLLGYADESGELPVAPIPHLLARNGTFMVYRKMHQNVAMFRTFLEEQGRLYPGGKEKLASKFVGRWRDGTPVEISPDRMDPDLVKDNNHNTDFTYGKDLSGLRCPIGAHIRRGNPRDSFGFNGELVNRRRIMRRGLPYGKYATENEPVNDQDEHGVIFIALNASIFRQFEFVQQQWIEYGNDLHQGNDKDLIIGNHGGKGKSVMQGTADPKNPPFICASLPNFVELRGGDYFFMPSLTALQMMASGTVDPR